MGVIRKYIQDNCDDIGRFLERYFPEKPNAFIKRSRHSKYYRWRFGPSLLGQAIIYIYWENTSMMGCFGAVPVPLRIRHESVLAYQLTDAFVAPEMHGKGIFRLLADEVFNEIEKQGAVCFGMSPSNYILPILTKKYDMSIGPTYRQVYSPIRFDEILKAMKLRFISPIGNLINPIRQNPLFRDGFEAEKISNISRLGLIDSHRNYDFSVEKTSAYLSYRYEQCPEPYAYYKVRYKKKCEFVLVVKLLPWNGMTICYLVDAIGDLDGRESASFLCNAIFDIGRRTLSAAVCLELHKPRKELQRLLIKGFLCHNREECVIIRQNRWNFLKPSSPDYDSAKWHFFSGDADYI
jgi:GNAT superfamily N-acetyltransferase